MSNKKKEQSTLTDSVANFVNYLKQYGVKMDYNESLINFEGKEMDLKDLEFKCLL